MLDHGPINDQSVSCRRLIGLHAQLLDSRSTCRKNCSTVKRAITCSRLSKIPEPCFRVPTMT